MRALGWSLRQSDWCPYKKKKLGHRHTQREDPVEDTGRRTPFTSQGRGPQRKPTSLRFTLDFQVPEL